MKVAGTQDGSVVLAGTTCMPDDRDRDIWVYILDSGGKKIAEYLFGGDGEEYSSAVHVDDMGCIAIATSAPNTANAHQTDKVQGWNGIIVHICRLITASGSASTNNPAMPRLVVAQA